MGSVGVSCVVEVSVLCIGGASAASCGLGEAFVSSSFPQTGRGCGVRGFDARCSLLCEGVVVFWMWCKRGMDVRVDCVRCCWDLKWQVAWCCVCGGELSVS